MGIDSYRLLECLAIAHSSGFTALEHHLRQFVQQIDTLLHGIPGTIPFDHGELGVM